MIEETKNSEKFIKSTLGNKNPFTTPENYFENIEEDFATKLATNDFPKKNPFKVSEGYFDHLEDTIFSKIEAERKHVNLISLQQKLIKGIPFAAAAAILLFIGFNSFQFNLKETMTLDSLSESDLEYWLDSNTLHESDIATVLEDDIIGENTFYFSEIEDESIEDYLNTDTNSYLLNELK